MALDSEGPGILVGILDFLWYVLHPVRRDVVGSVSWAGEGGGGLMGFCGIGFTGAL